MSKKGTYRYYKQTISLHTKANQDLVVRQLRRSNAYASNQTLIDKYFNARTKKGRQQAFNRIIGRTATGRMSKKFKPLIKTGIDEDNQVKTRTAVKRKNKMKKDLVRTKIDKVNELNNLDPDLVNNVLRLWNVYNALHNFTDPTSEYWVQGVMEELGISDDISVGLFLDWVKGFVDGKQTN